MAPTTPLFDPDAYFGSRYTPLKTVLLLVAGFWLAMIGYLLVLARSLMASAPAFPEVSLTALVPAVAIIMGITLVIVWALETALLFGITRVVGGTGSVGTTLAIAAWGFVPQTVAVLLEAATTPLATPDEPITAEEPAAIAEQFAASVPTAVTLLSYATLAVTALWTVYIWTYGLAHVHDVSVRKAAIGAVSVAVVVPLVLNAF